MWARLNEDGVVAEIINFDPSGKFHPSIQFVECGDDVIIGDQYSDGVFFKPEPPALHRSEAETLLLRLYDREMINLQNGYSDQEVKTFYIKSLAARSLINNTATEDQLSYLETLKGERGRRAQMQMAEKILRQERGFLEKTAQVERICNEHRERLSDEDNRSVVDSLISAYQSFRDGISE